MSFCHSKYKSLIEPHRKMCSLTALLGTRRGYCFPALKLNSKIIFFHKTIFFFLKFIKVIYKQNTVNNLSITHAHQKY